MTERPRQYVLVKFRPRDHRTYTYHNDGPPVAAGDEVKIPDRSGDGWKRFTVHEISWLKPAFNTKAILGLHEPEPQRRDLLSDLDDEVQQSLDRDRE